MFHLPSHFSIFFHVWWLPQGIKESPPDIVGLVVFLHGRILRPFAALGDPLPDPMRVLPRHWGNCTSKDVYGEKST
jgi:hypothetical protein